MPIIWLGCGTWEGGLKVLTIIDHPLWPEIRPYVKLEIRKDNGVRLEIRSFVPNEILQKAKDIEVKCAHCLAPIKPIKRRKQGGRVGELLNPGHFYLSATCLQKNNPGCSRSRKAAEEHERIKIDVLQYQEQNCSRVWRPTESILPL